MKFSDCKSVVEEKYVYGIGDEFRIACHHMFSTQSHITHIERIKNSYDSFYELLKNETIYDTDFGVHTKPIFTWLAEWMECCLRLRICGQILPVLQRPV